MISADAIQSPVLEAVNDASQAELGRASDAPTTATGSVIAANPFIIMVPSVSAPPVLSHGGVKFHVPTNAVDADVALDHCRISDGTNTYGYDDLRPAPIASEFATLVESYTDALRDCNPIDESHALQQAFENFVTHFRAWQNETLLADSATTEATQRKPLVHPLPGEDYISHPSTPVVRTTLAAISTAGISNGKGWTEDDSLPMFSFPQKDGTIEVSLRNAIPKDQLSLAIDTFIIMIANHAAHHDVEGNAEIDVPMILDERGIKRKSTSDGVKTYKGSHRSEDIEKVSKCVEIIRQLYVNIHNFRVHDKKSSKRDKHRIINNEKSPYIIVSRARFDAHNGVVA